MTKPEIQIKILKHSSSTFKKDLFKRACHDLIHCRTRLCDYMILLINSLIQGLGAGTRNFLYLNGRLHQKHTQSDIRELMLLRNHSTDKKKKEEKIMYFERLGTLTCIHNKSHLSAVFSKAVIWLSECLFNPRCRLKNTAFKTVSIQCPSQDFCWGLFDLQGTTDAKLKRK